MFRKKLTDEEIREIFFNSDEDEVNFDSETSESDSDDELPPNLLALEKGDDVDLSATTVTQGDVSNLAEQVSSTCTATSNVTQWRLVENYIGMAVPYPTMLAYIPV